MEDPPISGEIARTVPLDAHDAQLSNGPMHTCMRMAAVAIERGQLYG
jgi:hypothetical protein